MSYWFPYNTKACQCFFKKHCQCRVLISARLAYKASALPFEPHPFMNSKCQTMKNNICTVYVWDFWLQNRRSRNSGFDPRYSGSSLSVCFKNKNFKKILRYLVICSIMRQRIISHGIILYLEADNHQNLIIIVKSKNAFSL